MSFNFSNILSALTSTGNTAAIPGVISALGNIGLSSVSSRVTAQLNQLAAEMNNPDAVKQIVTNIEVTPGVPPSVLPLLESLKQPGVTALQAAQAIAAIEAQVASANSLTSLL